ncbi:hypothetical protein IV417_09995 [Alphaproteobacteria bacterium KMM 3653]|uniref:Lipoprotein n=1 Tax=Harenicola maris TaxID=2841044 RepID=A0AAP2CQE9_9RHOB|nr:hypothetical protein [Harenicola maris]
MRALLALALLALAGCQPPLTEDEKAKDRPLGYELRSTGIGVPASALEVSFGRVQPSALNAIEKLAGHHDEMTYDAACGAEIYHFRDGLTVTIRQGSFDGWTLKPGTRPEAGLRRAGVNCG